MKHAIKSLCAAEELWGDCWLHISWLINGRAVGGTGVREPARVLGNEAWWQIYVPPHPLPPILCAHDKVPHRSLSHLLEMSLHVRMYQARRDGMKMAINANEKWALVFCLMSQWLFLSFPCPLAYPCSIPLPDSHLSRQTNSLLFTFTNSTIPRSLYITPHPHTCILMSNMCSLMFHYSSSPGPSSCCVCVIYLQSVLGQRLGSFHDDLLDPLNWQVTSSLLQTLTEEADHLKVTNEETRNHDTEPKAAKIHFGLIEMACTWCLYGLKHKQGLRNWLVLREQFDIWGKNAFCLSCQELDYRTDINLISVGYIWWVTMQGLVLLQTSNRL